MQSMQTGLLFLPLPPAPAGINDEYSSLLQKITTKIEKTTG